MKKNLIWLLVLLVMLTAVPASAWFWEKKVDKVPPVTREIKKDSTDIVRKRGFFASFKETGREIKVFFKGLGRDVRDDSKKVPGEAKKQAKAAGRSLKKTGKEIGRESKKVPGALKEGAKGIGKGFKKLGKDIKEGTEKVLNE